MAEHDENKLGKVARVFLIIFGLGALAHWTAAMLGQWWLGWEMVHVDNNRVSAIVLAMFALLIWTKKKRFK